MKTTYALISIFDPRGDTYEVSLLSVGHKRDIYNSVKKIITTDANTQLACGFISNHTLKDIIYELDEKGIAELNAEMSITYKEIRKKNYVMLFWRPSINVEIRTYDDKERANQRFDEIVDRENENNRPSELNGCVALYEINYPKKLIIKMRKEFTF